MHLLDPVCITSIFTLDGLTLTRGATKDVKMKAASINEMSKILTCVSTSGNMVLTAALRKKERSPRSAVVVATIPSQSGATSPTTHILASLNAGATTATPAPPAGTARTKAATSTLAS